MSEPSYPLPTVHMNGTSRKMLSDGYDLAGEQLYDFIQAWGDIEFNARDYYPGGPKAWEQALQERESMSLKIRDVRDYISRHREHLHFPQ